MGRSCGVFDQRQIHFEHANLCAIPKRVRSNKKHDISNRRQPACYQPWKCSSICNDRKTELRHCTTHGGFLHFVMILTFNLFSTPLETTSPSVFHHDKFCRPAIIAPSVVWHIVVLSLVPLYCLP